MIASDVPPPLLDAVGERIAEVRDLARILPVRADPGLAALARRVDPAAAGALGHAQAPATASPGAGFRQATAIASGAGLASAHRAADGGADAAPRLDAPPTAGRSPKGMKAQPVYSSATGYIGEQFFTIVMNTALDAANPPPASAFEAQVNGTDATIASIQIDAGSNSVGVIFASTSLLAGDIIDFVYTDPTAGNDVNALQGTDGADAASFSQSIVVSIIRPGPFVARVVQTSGNGFYKAGDTVTLKVSFDQAVVVDDSGGPPRILLETGTNDQYAVYVSGSGSADLVFSYVVQPDDTSADLQYFDTASFDLNGGTIVSVANGSNASVTLPGFSSGNSLAETSALVIDTTAPATPSAPDLVAASDSGSSNSDNRTSDTTPTFTGTADANVTVTLYDTDGSTVLGSTTADGSGNWSITSSSLANGPHDVTAKTSDAAGNRSAASSALTVTIDTQRPTATLVLADTALRIGETTGLTVTFSEAVIGFTAADLTVSNGTLSALSSADGGTTWTATFTPSAGVQDASNVVTLDNTGVVDAAGNAGSGTTDSGNYAVDTQRPTVAISLSDSALAIGQTATVTFTFSEAVSGLTAADVTVANGSLSGLASADGGVTWTATLTPAAGVEDASNLVQLDLTGVVDQAGNAGSGFTDSANYAVDTRRPTATLALSDTALTGGETATLTLTFSEAVTGLTAADLTVANGTLSAPSTADGGTTWTATLTPSSGVSDASNVVTLDNTGVTDAAGNAGSGSTDSPNYTIDTSAQTATITLSDSALRIGETALVSITFSEAVLGFSNADLTVANGTLTPVSSADGGLTWTATFTPAVDIEDASNVIILDNTGVSDTANNPGTGTTSSANYTIDTRAPTATVAVADSALTRGESSAVSVVFSEVVSGFDASDLSVGNGTLSAFTSTDGGRSYTATFTPQGNLVVASTTLRLTLAGMADLAGNPGAGTVDSNAFSIDTTGVPDAPTAVTGVAGNQQISVSWTAPTETGGNPLLDYTATATPPPPAQGVAGQCTSSAPATTCTITGLVNGTRYQLGVTARTQSGSSSAGVGAAAVTPFGPPQPPTNIQVVISGTSAAVSWTAPSNSGGLPITGYTVTTSPGGFTCAVTGAPPPTACTIPNLPSGTYTFSVVATNAGGAAGAPGTAAGSTGGSTPQVIPVASPWGLGGLGLLTALFGWFGLRRRETASGTRRR
jgi:hypothetical protein